MKEFNKKVLSNGVVLYLYSDKNLKRTFVSYSIKFGSSGIFNDFYYKNKKCKIPFGVAHFLEHTLIEKSRYGNIFHHFVNEGHITNGTTYDELTSFYFFGINNIKPAIEKLIKMVDTPVFGEKDIEDVKSAVIEELNSRFDDKFSLVNTSNYRNMFSSVDIASKSRNALGTSKDTKNFTYEMIKLAYDAYYNDENKILVIAGDIDEKEMINYIENIYKTIPQHPNNLRKIKRNELMKIRKKSEIIPFHIKGPALGIRSYKFKNIWNMDNYKLSLYLHIYNYLKFNSSTKFFERLLSNKEVIDIDYMIDFIGDFNDIFLIRYIVESNDCNNVFKKLEKQLNTNNLSKKEFELRKKHLIVQNIKKRDHIYEVFGNFSYRLFFTDKLDDVDLIKSLDYKEMISIINDLKFDIYSTSIIEYKTS